LYFVSSGTRIGAWLKRNGKWVFRPLTTTGPELSTRIVELRERYHSDRAVDVEDTLRQLRQDVLGPFDHDLKGLDSLHIVPDGILFAVPFAALVDGTTGHYLVQDTELSFSHRLSRPSPTSFDSPIENVLLVGEPLAPTAPALPGARHEVAAIASMYPPGTTVVLTGEAATEAALREALPAASLLHFAGHSVVRPEAPGYSQLLLSTGTGTGADDGSLTVLEFRKNVSFRKGALVVLASCATAAPQLDRRFGVAQISAELIGAGARGVIATVDQIPDSSSVLFIAFHRHLSRGSRPSVALRLAQMELLTQPTKVSVARWALAQYYTHASSKQEKSDHE